MWSCTISVFLGMQGCVSEVAMDWLGVYSIWHCVGASTLHSSVCFDKYQSRRPEKSYCCLINTMYMGAGLERKQDLRHNIVVWVGHVSSLAGCLP